MRKAAVLIFLLFTMGCGNVRLVPPRSVSSAVDYAIKQEKTQQIVIKEYTDFTWDKVYIFGPYTTSEAVNEILGFKWEGYASFDLAMQDTFDLIVFVRNDQVVRVERHLRSKGDFQEETLGKAYSPDDAIFVIKNEAGWYQLGEQR